MILRKSQYFAGAERLTSGFAELSAEVESLLWQASMAVVKRNNNNTPKTTKYPELTINIGDIIVFTLDSMYVGRLLQGKMFY